MIPRLVGLLCCMLSVGCKPTKDDGGDGPCEPGDICTWFGTPEIAGMAEDGTPRTEGSTFWAVDVIFHPIDNWPVIMDWNNHRIITIDEDDLSLIHI